MLSEECYNKLLVNIKSEFPNFRIVKKSDSKLMKFIDGFLKKASFGKTKNFMEDFTTTIGVTVYIPNKWYTFSTSTKAITMRHELVHMRQAKRSNTFVFSLLYLCLPFPVGLAYYRMKFEKEAYRESLQAMCEYYGPKFFTPALKECIVNHFASAEYFWTWPWKKSNESWYDNVVASITKKYK